jgi:hypothetical protein
MLEATQAKVDGESVVMATIIWNDFPSPDSSPSPQRTFFIEKKISKRATKTFLAIPGVAKVLINDNPTNYFVRVLIDDDASWTTVFDLVTGLITKTLRYLGDVEVIQDIHENENDEDIAS